MTILYIHDKFSDFGGVERVFIDKMNYLADHDGYHVIMLSYIQNGNNIVFYTSQNISHIDLNVPIYLEFRYKLIKRLLYHRYMVHYFCKKIKNFIKENHVDIVIGTTYDYFLLEVLNKLHNDVKVVIEPHIYRDFILEHLKGGFFKELYYRYRFWRLCDFLKNADAFVTLTKGDSSAWSDVRKSIVIPNCLISGPGKLNSSETLNKRVISVGRLEAQKGYDILLKVWNKVKDIHSDWHLDIYGDGSLKSDLLIQRDNLNLQDYVDFHDPTIRIFEKYCRSDFYVMSSRYEGFGMVLIEAMSCGLPCVSFDCPCGPSEIIRDGEDGILVENGNIQSLSDKICYLIEHEEIRKVMAGNARENVRRFSPEEIMPKWKELFETLFH